jgi:hypothetical protein
VEPEEAFNIIREGEGQRTEFKQSFAEEDDAIKALCAFANAEGGAVFFGVKDDGEIIGVTLGQNTLENFVNKLRSRTSPPLSPSIEQLSFKDRVVVVATVQKASKGQLFYAFNRPYIRIGKTIQVMSPEEQRARLQAGESDWSEERDRPTFEAIKRSLRCLENKFEPEFRLRQVSGDYVANLEWRFRGPRFQMDWQPATGHALERTKISGTFDLTVEPGEDDLVQRDEIALEIRFWWRGRRRHELHRWPITRKELPQKIHWDMGREILPPLYFDEQ